MNIDGSNPQKITNTAESEVGAVWIKNGTKIAFLSSTDDGMQLFTMDPNGENRKQISNVEKASTVSCSPPTRQRFCSSATSNMVKRRPTCILTLTKPM